MPDYVSTNVALEVFGALIMLILLVCLLMDERRDDPLRKRLIRIVCCQTVVLVSDAAAFLFDGSAMPCGSLLVNASNFLLYLFSYLLLIAFSDYMAAFFSGRARIARWIPYVTHAVCALGVALVIVSQFNGMFFTVDAAHVYHRESWFWLSQALGILCMLLIFSMVFLYRGVISRRELAFFLLYQILPVIALVLQIFITGPAFLNAAMTLSVVIVCAGIQVEQSRLLEQKEKELSENRIAIMLSQIQPNFLYNALSVIAMECDEAPAEAQKAIVDFAVYLRGNIDSLKQKDVIPFEKELKHTEVYINLERIRLGAGLRVSYDIGTTAFWIPPLTMQPIVENAVKNGAWKREGGRTVSIATLETGTDFVITVSDDGEGEDPEAFQGDGHARGGIDSVRHRLGSQCGGTLAMQSKPGAGTVATVHVPKRNYEHKHNGLQ